MKTTAAAISAVISALALGACSDATRVTAAPSPVLAGMTPPESQAAPATGVTSEVEFAPKVEDSYRLGSASPFSAPSIRSVSPSRVYSRCAPQTLTVSGSGFESGLVVRVVDPAGRRSTLAAPSVWNVTANSFQMALYTGPVAGLWKLQPVNPDGGTSLPDAILADGVYAPAPPYVRSMSPSRVRANGATQSVVISGGNFQRGLFATYTAPGGQKSTVGGGQIASVTANTIRISLRFGTRAGIGQLHLTNPDCGESGLPLSFFVD